MTSSLGFVNCEMVTRTDISEEHTASIFRMTELPQMDEVIQRSLWVTGQSQLWKVACGDK
jgi:hypothetical protein